MGVPWTFSRYLSFGYLELLSTMIGLPIRRLAYANDSVARRATSEVAFTSHVAGMANVRFNPGTTAFLDLIDEVERAGHDGRHEYWAVPLNQAAG